MALATMNNQNWPYNSPDEIQYIAIENGEVMPCRNLRLKVETHLAHQVTGLRIGD